MARTLRALAGLVGIILIIVGVPWLLINTVGWPFPDHVPTWAEARRVVAQRDFGTSFVLGLLAIIGWVLWAQVVWATIWELAVNISRARAHRAPRAAPFVAAPIGRLVAVAIMSVLALTSRPSPATALGPGSLEVPHAAVNSVLIVDSGNMYSPPSAASSSVQTASETTSHTWTVHEGDTLWDVAEFTLGDGARVDEILELNPGVESDVQMRPGRVLRLPDNVVNTQSEVVVERGDNLWTLTETMWGDTDMERINEVADRNDIADPHMIYPGEVFDLSDPLAPAPPPLAEPNSKTSFDTAGSADTALPDGSVERQTHEVDLEPAGDELRSASQDDSNVVAQPVDAPTNVAESADSAESAKARLDLLPVQLSVLLSTGVLGLLALRRRTWWQSMRQWIDPSADAVALERALQASADLARTQVRWTEHRLRQVWSAVSSLAGDSSAELAAVINRGADGLAAHFNNDLELPDPWRGGGRIWHLDAVAIGELLDSNRSDREFPALVELGAEDDGSPLFVDLEVLQTLEIGGPENAAEAIANAVALGISARVGPVAPLLISVDSESSPLDGCLDGLHVSTFAEAEDRVQLVGAGPRESTPRPGGPTAGRSAVVVVAPGIQNVRPLGIASTSLVSAAAVNGPSQTLVPDGDFWVLRPLGVRLRPVGVDAGEAELLADLFEPGGSAATPPPVAPGEIVELVPPAPPGAPPAVLLQPPQHFVNGQQVGGDVDDTIPRGRRAALDSPPSTDMVPTDMVPMEQPAVPPELGDTAGITIRLLGAPEVTGPNGQVVAFPDPRQLELLVWLATHRERPTRTAARGAIWNFDVGESEFVRVLEGLRHSLRSATQTDVDWIGDSHTELVPVHPAVRTDAEALERSLVWAQSASPAERLQALGPRIESLSGMPLDTMSYSWAHSEGIHHHLVRLGSRVFMTVAEAYTELGEHVAAQDAAEEGLAVFAGHEGLFEKGLAAAAARDDRSEVGRLFDEYGPSLPQGAANRFARSQYVPAGLVRTAQSV